MARTSALSSFYTPIEAEIPSGLPQWVFGGSFNQIEENTNSLNNSQNILEQQRLNNEASRMKIRDAQDSQDFEDSVSGVFAERKPKTGREMYEIYLEQALKSGRAEEAMKMRDLIEKSEQQQREAALKNLGLGVDLAKIGADPLAQEFIRAGGKDPSSVFTEDFYGIRGSKGLFNMGRGKYRMGADGLPELVGEAPEKPEKVGSKAYFDEKTGQSFILPDTAEGEAEAIRRRLKPAKDIDVDLLPSNDPKKAEPGMLDGLKAIGRTIAGFASSPKTGEAQSEKQSQMVENLKADMERKMNSGDGKAMPPDGTIIRSNRDGKRYKIVGGVMVPYQG